LNHNSLLAAKNLVAVTQHISFFFVMLGDAINLSFIAAAR